MDGRDLNLIFYKKEAGILERVRRADALAMFAAVPGLPVRVLADERTLVLGEAGEESYARLYRYLPGRTIAWEGWQRKHIKLLGWAMSDLHFAVRDFAGELPSVIGETEELLERMDVYFADGNVKKALSGKLKLAVNPAVFKYFSRAIETAEGLPGQALHMDFVRGNILFDEASEDDVWQMGEVALTGVIDFEKAAHGAPVFDVARTLAFLYADVSSKTEEEIFKYFAVSGYGKRGRGFAKFDNALLGRLVGFYLFYDFYKFLRHNPYESLEENYHFRRTRELLLQRKMVKSV
jgi:Ser/Thr protein kinase RdoA (MazF antagonist)